MYSALLRFGLVEYGMLPVVDLVPDEKRLLRVCGITLHVVHQSYGDPPGSRGAPVMYGP